MISYLAGTVIDKGKDTLTILTASGVGYEVHMTAVSVMETALHADVSYFTYLKVGESSMDLYGFKSKDERTFFTLLLSVSGVGPKSALNILAVGSMEDIQAAIGRGDAKYLTAVQGIGKKTAERLVVELKNKLSAKGKDSGFVGDSGALGEAIDGLVAMGYSKDEAKEAVMSVDAKEKTTEQVLRAALKMLSR